MGGSVPLAIGGQGRVRAGCKLRGKRCSLGCILVGCQCPAVLYVAYWTD